MDEWKKEIIVDAIEFYKNKINNFLEHVENGKKVKNIINPYVLDLCNKELTNCDDLKKAVNEAKMLSLGDWEHPPFVKILFESLNFYNKTLNDDLGMVEKKFSMPFGDTNENVKSKLRLLERVLDELPSEEKIKELLEKAR